MVRHSKNAGGMGSEALTYHERRALGFGTVKERLGKDAQGNFYDCQLTQAPCVHPMCTPLGFLYSKEAILENLLAQKKENKRKLKLWEAQERAKSETLREKRLVEEEERKERFYKENHQGAVAGRAKEGGKAAADMNSFWLPSKTPEAESVVKKPSMTCFCPASGKKLKLKDLFAVTFTRDPEDPKRYIDPMTKDELSNKDALVVLKPLGVIMKMKTYESLVKPDGIYEDKKIAPKDVLDVQKGGTGFASHDRHAQSNKHFAVGIGSGLADVRGQGGGGGSKFGLRYAN